LPLEAFTEKAGKTSIRAAVQIIRKFIMLGYLRSA